MGKFNKTLILTCLLLMCSTSISLSQLQETHPHFISYTASIECPYGTDANFDYEISGTPSPALEIRYDNGLYLNRDLKYIDSEGLPHPKYEVGYYGNTCKFRIYSVDERDVRWYNITIFNSAGTFTVLSSLTINSY